MFFKTQYSVSCRRKRKNRPNRLGTLSSVARSRTRTALTTSSPRISSTDGAIVRRYLRIAQDSLEIAIAAPEKFSLAVKNHNRFRVIRQRERFLERGIAAADHAYYLAIVKRPVATGAVADAPAHQFGFAGNAEFFERRTGGDDDCFGAMLLFIGDD